MSLLSTFPIIIWFLHIFAIQLKLISSIAVSHSYAADIFPQPASFDQSKTAKKRVDAGNVWRRNHLWPVDLNNYPGKVMVNQLKLFQKHFCQSNLLSFYVNTKFCKIKSQWDKVRLILIRVYWQWHKVLE